MKRIRLMLVTAALLTITASLVHAGTATPRVERREVRQQARIAQGVKSGELTPRETMRAEAGQAHVERVENRAKADGVVTPAERAKLNHAQNRQSRVIHRLKHNDRVR